MLIQTFEQVSTGGRFTIAVNHLKSKGSPCDGDPDALDGQGNCNLTRAAAAEALADYLATDPTGSGDPDVLVVGDLNSYRLEDPITELRDAGYTDLQEHFETADAYSYVFDGQLGYLDTALANPALFGQVTGTTTWHINADEVPLFDYNDAIRDPGELQAFERESNALELYEPDPLRSSDHDPVLVGLYLATPERALATLEGDLAGMTIQKGVKNALTAKLASVAAALASGDDAGACAALDGFAEFVTSQQGKKIATADAAVLLTGAEEVGDLIPC